MNLFLIVVFAIVGYAWAYTHHPVIMKIHDKYGTQRSYLGFMKQLKCSELRADLISMCWIFVSIGPEPIQVSGQIDASTMKVNGYAKVHYDGFTKEGNMINSEFVGIVTKGG